MTPKRTPFRYLVLVAALCSTSSGFSVSSASRCLSSKLLSNQKSVADNVETAIPPFSHHGPFLAIVTERSGCDSDEKLAQTLEILRAATSTEEVDLVSVRMSLPEATNERQVRKERVVELVQQLLQWSASATRNKFRVVVSSDWIDAAMEAGAHGVHFKETHRSRIPDVRRRFPHEPLIGTSTHSVESALNAWDLYKPDYFFVGTCYFSESHPEKTEADLEGPELPGMVRLQLDRHLEIDEQKPPVLAIGGIDDSNCHVPIEFGAKGVAVIRAVFSDSDPSKAVQSLTRIISSCPTLGPC